MEQRILSFPIMGLAARALGARVHLATELLEIGGSSERVDGLVVRQDGMTRWIDCDGVVFSAGWIPEAAAFAGSAIELAPETGGIAIDQATRTSVPGVFAAGNVLRPVESSGWAACEGRRAGQLVAHYLAGSLPATRGTTRLRAGNGISYVVPQYWDGFFDNPTGVAPLKPSARAAADTEGVLTLLSQRGSARIGKVQRHLRNRRIKFNLADPVLNSDTVLDINQTRHTSRP